MDKCQFCRGAKGGEPGNENIVGGIVMCDDCDALFITALRSIAEHVEGDAGSGG